MTIYRQKPFFWVSAARRWIVSTWLVREKYYSLVRYILIGFTNDEHILTGWGWFSTLSGSKHLNNTTKIRRWNWRLAFISGAGWKEEKNRTIKKRRTTTNFPLGSQRRPRCLRTTGGSNNWGLHVSGRFLQYAVPQSKHNGWKNILLLELFSGIVSSSIWICYSRTRSRFPQFEKFTLNFSKSSFAICLSLLHP